MENRYMYIVECCSQGLVEKVAVAALSIGLTNEEPWTALPIGGRILLFIAEGGLNSYSGITSVLPVDIPILVLQGLRASAFGIDCSSWAYFVK
jgi:hypothetical protein